LSEAEAAIAQNTTLIQQLLAREEGRIEVIREFFEENEGETVTVVATFDVIVGVVETVGTDVVVIVAPNGDVFIIPYTSVITVATGTQGGV
jgi:2,3-bisphosphoglycerate-independent phosphoglycerate mutase